MVQRFAHFLLWQVQRQFSKVILNDLLEIKFSVLMTVQVLQSHRMARLHLTETMGDSIMFRVFWLFATFEVKFQVDYVFLICWQVGLSNNIWLISSSSNKLFLILCHWRLQTYQLASLHELIIHTCSFQNKALTDILSWSTECTNSCGHYVSFVQVSLCLSCY